MIEAVVLFLSLSGAPPPYVYRDRTLELRPEGLAPKTEVLVTWRSLDRNGRASGRKMKRALVSDDEARLTFDVDVAGGHEVILRFGRTTARYLATRGTWFVFPRTNQWDVSRTAERWPESGAIVGGAFSAKVVAVRTPKPPEIGRTLGLDMGTAINAPKKGGLAIVASSTQEGLVVTLTEPLKKDVVRYWDLPINVALNPKRYVLAFSAFRRRDGKPGRLRSIGALTMRGLEVARTNDTLRVDSIAIVERVPSVERIRRRKNGIDVTINDLGRGVRALLHVRGAKTSTAVMVKRSRLRLRGAAFADATDVWLWTSDANGAVTTDPPDAPVSAYMIGGRSDELVIDDFKGATPLNAERRRTHVFTSTVGFDGARFSSRVTGIMRLEDPDRNKLEYVGYETPMPERMSKAFKKIRLVVRGKGPADKVMIGLRDRSGAEPKVPLPIPLDGQWRSAVILLEKFGKRRFDAATVTLLSDEEAEQSIEVRRISLIP